MRGLIWWFFDRPGATAPPAVLRPGDRFYRYVELWKRAYVRGLATWDRIFLRKSITFDRTWKFSMNRIPATVRPKTANEVRDYIVDFSAAPEFFGDSERTIDTIMIVDGVGLTFGTPEVNAEVFDGVPIGRGVVVRISGGVAGSYDFTIQAILDNGAKLEVPCRLVVV